MIPVHTAYLISICAGINVLYQIPSAVNGLFGNESDQDKLIVRQMIAYSIFFVISITAIKYININFFIVIPTYFLATWVSRFLISYKIMTNILKSETK